MPGQCLETYGLKRHSLAKEITLALLLKVLVIYALWSAFFSQPVDDNLSGPEVGKAFFGAAAATSPSPAGAILEPENSSPENTGSENTGSEIAGSEIAGSEMTGPQNGKGDVR